ncbi:outer membrane lipoprotein-sorting protein [Cystobacter ferrugineus]|uniref:Outer membrane lipoprotein-sorting protein n=2 Tax=Cystobacter TaxID=42 RepID=A0A1L9B6P2_9BACT|nr:outer membrane lipoprotein-sorting protein [Cystobacter ferrugineus]AKP45403.1 hypothetical protein [Cystobacter sp. Cbv34]OJH37939.1 outer membrane lipoprotein-sorting protein [Cystobacter ferrugineus]QQZ45549.1 hypothetical protein [synthetic construct]
MTLRNLLGALFAALLLAAPTARADLTDPAEIKKLLETLDNRQRNGGDYKSLVYIEQKEKDKTDVVREAVVYRRDEKDQLMILMTKPKGEAGKGYLRLDKNLWSYDPNTGKWDRRTERERIAGTDSRRADFDESRLAEELDGKFEGEEKLGKFTTWKLVLTAKPNVDVAYPVVHLWVEKDTNNILKRQEFALSGRLMRTSYFPKWMKLFSESKKADVWYPQEMRFYDEVEKTNSTVIVVKSVDLRSLEENIFTKAWFESKSR